MIEVNIDVYTDTTIHDAERIISDAVAHKKMVLILGKCRVEYEGRGASRIGYGERLVIIKPDGAVLVHRPTGYSPVNWQPDSKVIEVYTSGVEVIVKSVRERPREILRLYFSSIKAIIVVSGMEDKAEFIEYVDESEIRDYLVNHPEAIEKGMHVISVEKPVESGYVDIYARDANGTPVVIEVKRVTADKNAVAQLYRYVEAIRRENKDARVRGILVAPSITKNALHLLNSLGLEYRQIDPVKIYRELREEKRRGRGEKTLLSFLVKKQ